MRDITRTFWAFVGMMSAAAVDDVALFRSDAYRDMCEAVHCGDRLAISVSPTTRLVFDDVTALFEAEFEDHVGAELAGRVRRCVDRIQSWVDAEELTALFGRAL